MWLQNGYTVVIRGPPRAAVRARWRCREKGSGAVAGPPAPGGAASPPEHKCFRSGRACAGFDPGCTMDVVRVGRGFGHPATRQQARCRHHCKQPRHSLNSGRLVHLVYHLRASQVLFQLRMGRAERNGISCKGLFPQVNVTHILMRRFPVWLCVVCYPLPLGEGCVAEAIRLPCVLAASPACSQQHSNHYPLCSTMVDSALSPAPFRH